MKLCLIWRKIGFFFQLSWKCQEIVARFHEKNMNKEKCALVHGKIFPNWKLKILFGFHGKLFKMKTAKINGTLTKKTLTHFKSYKPYSLFDLTLYFLVRSSSNIARLEQKLLKLNERPKIGAVSGNLFGGNET